MPASRELRITLPGHVAEHEQVEIILLISAENSLFAQKVSLMQDAATDPLYLDDLRRVSEDFDGLDAREWGDDGTA